MAVTAPDLAVQGPWLTCGSPKAVKAPDLAVQGPWLTCGSPYKAMQRTPLCCAVFLLPFVVQ
eukprot:1157757-Pelagomonas_calceolata.AAC.11